MNSETTEPVKVGDVFAIIGHSYGGRLSDIRKVTVSRVTPTGQIALSDNPAQKWRRSRYGGGSYDPIGLAGWNTPRAEPWADERHNEPLERAKQQRVAEAIATAAGNFNASGRAEHTAHLEQALRLVKAASARGRP